MSYSLKDILKSLKVLFISSKDNVSSKELNILDMFFHKIICVSSAERALKIYSNEHPDVIITDIKLFKMSGIDFCKIVRKTNINIPIIIISKDKDEKYLFEAIRLQVIDFVVRPIKVENLIFALNQTAKYMVNNGNITIKLKNGYIYNYKEKSILKEDGTVTKLTKNEFKLLELLIANKHKTLTKKEIEAYIWTNDEITQSAFKSLFSRLRQKIGKDSIENSFGIGYQLV